MKTMSDEDYHLSYAYVLRIYMYHSITYAYVLRIYMYHRHVYLSYVCKVYIFCLTFTSALYNANRLGFGDTDIDSFSIFIEWCKDAYC